MPDRAGRHYTKPKQLGLQLKKLLVRHTTELIIKIKLLLYNYILKTVWTYGIELWRSASKSNIEILQRFQSKVLRVILNTL